MTAGTESNVPTTDRMIAAEVVGRLCVATARWMNRLEKELHTAASTIKT